MHRHRRVLWGVLGLLGVALISSPPAHAAPVWSVGAGEGRSTLSAVGTGVCRGVRRL
jgi:hypothetical protein